MSAELSKAKIIVVTRASLTTTIPSSPARLLFFSYCYFLLGYPAGASVEERESPCEYLFLNLSKTLVS